MKSNIHYFVIGLFILIVSAMMIGGIILFNSEVFQTNRLFVETYLDESVQGLSQGTALLYRGVAIGRIEKITFVPQVYDLSQNPKDFEQFSRYIMIIMSVDKSNFKQLGIAINNIEAMLRNQINSGLRLKLTYQGITGIALLEADFVDPVRNPPLLVPWKPKNLFIPSAKSLITNFTQAVDTVFQRLEKIDFPQIFEQLDTTLKSIQTGVDEARLGEVRQSAVELMEQLNKTVKEDLPKIFEALNQTLQDVQVGLKEARLSEISRTAEKLMTQLTQTVKEAEILLKVSDPNMPTVSIADTVAQFNTNLKQIETVVSTHQGDIDAILADLKALTRNLKQLSEQIKADPAQLFFSTPPAKTEIEK